jgi:hypothetical protein
MIQNEELISMPHPLIRAHRLQKHIEILKQELAGAETEYNQIVLHCREKKELDDGEYHLTVKSTTRHKIVPEKFAELFPEANTILLSLESKYIQSELDRLIEKRILPSIKMEDAKKHVGSVALLQACIPSVTEHVTITVDTQQ